MIFIEGCHVIDMMGDLPERPRKVSWTDGEKFRMIFTKYMNGDKEVIDEKDLDRQRDSRGNNFDATSYILDHVCHRK